MALPMATPPSTPTAAAAPGDQPSRADAGAAAPASTVATRTPQATRFMSAPRGKTFLGKNPRAVPVNDRLRDRLPNAARIATLLSGRVNGGFTAPAGHEIRFTDVSPRPPHLQVNRPAAGRRDFSPCAPKPSS